MKYTVILSSLMLLASPLAAQSVAGSRVGLSQRSTPDAAFPPNRTMRMEVQRSYWLEGSVIGGVLGLVGGLQPQHSLCNFDGPCSGFDHFFFLIPTLVLSVVGGLIGSAIHKR
jgi:hypothetical protein